MKQTEQYFSYDPDNGFETFATEEEAKKFALATIELYNVDADDGWPEEVERIYYGRIIGHTVEKQIKHEIPLCGDSKLCCTKCLHGEDGDSLSTPSCDDYDFSNDGREYIEYVLETIEEKK